MHFSMFDRCSHIFLLGGDASCFDYSGWWLNFPFCPFGAVGGMGGWNILTFSKSRNRFNEPQLPREYVRRNQCRLLWHGEIENLNERPLLPLASFIRYNRHGGLIRQRGNKSKRHYLILSLLYMEMLLSVKRETIYRDETYLTFPAVHDPLALGQLHLDCAARLRLVLVDKRDPVVSHLPVDQHIVCTLHPSRIPGERIVFNTIGNIPLAGNFLARQL